MVLAPDELVVTDTTGGFNAVVVITFGFTPPTLDGCASHLVFLLGSAKDVRTHVAREKTNQRDKDAGWDEGYAALGPGRNK